MTAPLVLILLLGGCSLQQLEPETTLVFDVEVFRHFVLDDRIVVRKNTGRYERREADGAWEPLDDMEVAVVRALEWNALPATPVCLDEVSVGRRVSERLVVAQTRYCTDYDEGFVLSESRCLQYETHLIFFDGDGETDASGNLTTPVAEYAFLHHPRHTPRFVHNSEGTWVLTGWKTLVLIADPV